MGKRSDGWDPRFLARPTTNPQIKQIFKNQIKSTTNPHFKNQLFLLKIPKNVAPTGFSPTRRHPPWEGEKRGSYRCARKLT